MMLLDTPWSAGKRTANLKVSDEQKQRDTGYYALASALASTAMVSVSTHGGMPEDGQEGT